MEWLNVKAMPWPVQHIPELAIPIGQIGVKSFRAVKFLDPAKNFVLVV
jgi:hypothetical protein